MLFARAKLAEPLPVTRAIGVLMFVLGAGAMAVAMASGGDHAMHQLDVRTILAMALLWLIGAPLVPLVLRGTRACRSDIVLGVLGGVFLAFDSILKGISQSHPDGSRFLPETQTGWLLFGASFLGSAGALGMVQWAHFRRSAPTNVIASYDLAYLAVPALCVHLLGDAPPITFGFVGAIALTLSGWWLIVRLSNGRNAQGRL